MAGELRNWAAAIGCVLGLVPCAAAGTLLAASNYEEFRGLSTDRFYRASTASSTILSSTIVNTTFPVGALSEVNASYVLAGSASSRVVRQIDLDGNLLGSTTTGLPVNCCNADFAYENGRMFRAHYSRGIYELNPATGAVLSFNSIPDVVGMTYVNGVIWISRWSTGQIGTWDPATNEFTLRFSLTTRVGGLAWDPDSATLWVGRQFGIVEPFDLNGNSIGPQTRPFGNIDESIDGLAYVIPEPSSFLLVVAGAALVLRRR